MFGHPSRLSLLKFFLTSFIAILALGQLVEAGEWGVIYEPISGVILYASYPVNSTTLNVEKNSLEKEYGVRLEITWVDNYPNRAEIIQNSTSYMFSSEDQKIRKITPEDEMKEYFMAVYNVTTGQILWLESATGLHRFFYFVKTSQRGYDEGKGGYPLDHPTFAEMLRLRPEYFIYDLKEKRIRLATEKERETFLKKEWREVSEWWKALPPFLKSLLRLPGVSDFLEKAGILSLPPEAKLPPELKDILHSIEPLPKNKIRATLEWSNYTLYVETSSAVLGVKFDSANKQLFIEISGPTGTSGELDLMVPADLVSPPNVRVSLDGKPLDFELISKNGLYLIHIEYTHSIHTLLFSLAPIPPWYTKPHWIGLFIGLVILGGIVYWFKFRR